MATHVTKPVIFSGARVEEWKGWGKSFLSRRISSVLQIKGEEQPSSENCRVWDVRPSPLKPEIAWNCLEFAAVLHIWQGQASATVWGLLSLTPLKRKQIPPPPPATHKDKASIKGTFVMTRRWQTTHLVWNQFEIRKISPHAYITGSTGSTWSKCLESSQLLVLISLTLLSVCLSMYNIIFLWFLCSFLLPENDMLWTKFHNLLLRKCSRREKEGQSLVCTVFLSSISHTSLGTDTPFHRYSRSWLYFHSWVNCSFKA